MDLSVSYIPPHQPQHIETDMKYLKGIGCTDVLCALQENHFVWLSGAVKYSAQIAKENGLNPRAVLWGYANTSGGGRSSAVMLKNPDIWRCDANGDSYLNDNEFGPQACYNNPRTAILYREYVEQIWDNGFTEVMIDEPSPQKCFCKYCKEKFAQRYKNDLVNSIHSEAYKEFQQRTVIDFAIVSSRTVKSVSEKCKVSIAIMPVDRPLFESMAAIPEIDVFAIDPYWLRPVNELSFDDAVKVSLDAHIIARNNHKKFELYLGCFGIAGGQGLEEKIYSEGKILVQKSLPDVLTTWSFRGGLGLRKKPEECDNPKLAWDNVVKLYRELQEKDSL
jgi:hypothetical protein